MMEQWTRRGMFAAGGALAGGSVAVGTSFLPDQAMAHPSAEVDAWEPVPPVDLVEFSPDLFDDDELTLPYYLAHLHRVANGVVEEGPLRGFIDIHVWRGDAENHPDHARIMENVLSFAYFYVTVRPWNVYRHSEPLRQRLEAGLNYLLGLQDENGIFPFDGGTDFGGPYESLSYANTAFVSKFFGEVAILLDADATLERSLRDNLMAALRKSLMYLLTENNWYEFVTQYSNQYTNVWAGTTGYLFLQEDAELRQLLLERMAESPGHFQSPTGFFYEGYGPDWSYTTSTHLSNVRMARHYAGFIADGDAIITMLNEELEAWTEFLSLNAVLEPDGGFVLNKAVETRSTMIYLDRVPEPGAQDVVAARAFAPSDTEIADLYERQRTELEQRWPEVEELEVGSSTYIPYQFLHRSHIRWYPTDEQRGDAIAMLPYKAENQFTQQRTDEHGPMTFTFVRRREYYAVFNSGTRPRHAQRLGLGLLWHEHFGAVTQSQSRLLDHGVWGTRADGVFYEATDMHPEFYARGQKIAPEPGVVDLPDGRFEIKQQLADKGDKSITFLSNEVHVRIRHEGEFAEDIPLVYNPDTDSIDIDHNRITLTHDGAQVTISVARNTGNELVPSDVQIWEEPPSMIEMLPFETLNRRAGDPSVGAKMLATIRIHANDSLFYRVAFP